MITSILYGICFLFLCFSSDKEVSRMSMAAIAYLVIENSVYYYFNWSINYFDISLYITIGWVIDVFFLICVANIFTKNSRKVIIFLGAIIICSQMIFVQFPYVLPTVSYYVYKYSYTTFVETFIMCGSFKDKTFKDVITLSGITSCLVFVHLLI